MLTKTRNNSKGSSKEDTNLNSSKTSLVVKLPNQENLARTEKHLLE